MEELGLPERLFQTGFEPSGRKRVNNYFNLRWIEVINKCISAEQQEMLADSQFHRILQMGQHTFSVMFVHQLLCRQLVTRKRYELWWTFAGKPIRYGIGEYALVTGLNCSKAATTSTCLGNYPKKKGKSVPGDGAVWKSLFGSEDKITPEWLVTRLAMGDKYKDADTRLRLSLLLLVEGILCPTSGATTVRPEVVELVGDIDAFLKYPWGRESFILTVRSVKARKPAQYANDTTSIQGFAHAIVLVTVCCCPQIVAEPGGDEELTIDELVEGVCGSNLKINVVTTKKLELLGQASVRSIICPDHHLERFDDEVDDVSVSHMVSLIKEDFPFEVNSWRGGVKANEAKKPNKSLVEECLDGEEKPSGSTFLPHVGSQPTHAPGGDGGVGVGGSAMVVESLLRLATDAFEERLVPMFEGYTLSVKDHIDQVVSSLKESVGAELAEVKKMLLRRDIVDAIIASAAYCEATPSAAKPNDGGINEGCPTNGTGHTEDMQDGDSARRELSVPPTASGERSPETLGEERGRDQHLCSFCQQRNSDQQVGLVRDANVLSPDVQQDMASSHLPNEDALRDIEDSTSFSPNEVSTKLPMLKDPGRFVLTSLDDALTGARQRGESSLAEPIVKTLVPLLEELARAVVSTDPGLQSDANKVAHEWVSMMGASVESQLEAWAFLHFIVAYGLVKLTKQDQTLQFASHVAHFRHAPKLFQSLGLTHAIPNFVTELLDKALYVPAIRFMFFFNVKNNISPLEFLKEQIINLRRSCKEKRRYESQAEANRDAATMRDIMELIDDFKLEIDIPVDLILKFMVPREIQIQNQRVVSSSVPVQSTHMQASHTFATHGSNPSLPTSFDMSPTQPAIYAEMCKAGGSTAVQGRSSHHAGSKRPRVDPWNGD